MLITNGTLLTFGPDKEVIPDGALLIEGERIADLGQTAELRARYPQAEEWDATGKLVMPGLICAHTHFYGAFARGMAIPGQAPANFPQILESLWWRLDKTLHYDDVRYSALVCLVDAVRHGATTLIDHHASPHALDGCLDVIAEATRQAGVRACLCYEVSDRDGEEIAQAGIMENVRFIRKLQSLDRGLEAPHLLAGTFGLHASLTLSDQTLERALEAAHDLGVGFHLHVAEDQADVKDSLKKSGLRVVERLHEWGILGVQTIAAHCVHVDAYEIDTLRETGTRVVHNPRSNMNNAVGVANVLKMLRQGLEVGLGNDGFSNNMFTEIAVTYLLHKLHAGDPRVMGADQVLDMAFDHNARTAELFFPAPLGQLSVGAQADVILVDYAPPTPLTADNFPWHIVFGVDGSGVDTTIVAGKALMRGRQLITLDEEEICATSRELAARVWARL